MTILRERMIRLGIESAGAADPEDCGNSKEWIEATG